jgi:hypothetical protein
MLVQHFTFLINVCYFYFYFYFLISPQFIEAVGVYTNISTLDEHKAVFFCNTSDIEGLHFMNYTEMTQITDGSVFYTYLKACDEINQLYYLDITIMVTYS